MNKPKWLFAEAVDRELLSFGDGQDIALESYVSVTMRSIRIRSSRMAFRRFYGALLSAINFSREGERAEVTRLVSPETLGLADVDKSTLDRVLIRDHILADRIAYKGGKIGFKAIVVAMESANLVGPYLTLAGSILNAVSPAFAAASKPFAGPASRVWEEVNGKGSEIGIGLAIEWDKPQTGLFCVTDRAKGAPGQLRVDDDGGLLEDGKPLTASYLVFEIESYNEKPDWKIIPELLGGYEKIKAALKSEKDRYEEVDLALAAFHQSLMWSPDLIESDALKIYSAVESRANAMLPGGQTSMPSKQATFPELREIEIYG